ncbi:MAG: oligoendopeptidase F [Clostridiales bacterium]|nr:oligoendopeptidase F [Clostridiales bacterium]
MERKEIAEKYQWKVSDLFASDEAWEKEFQAVEKEYGAIDTSVFENKLGDKATLLKCLSLNYEVAGRMEKLYIYAHLRHDEDVRDSFTTSALARITSLFSKVFSQFAFIDPQLTALDEGTLQSFIADPDFSEHDYKLKKLVESKAHVLSEKEEKLLALGSDVFGGFQDVFMMLDNANLNLPKATFKGEEVQMSHGLYGVVLHTGDREERKEWFEKYYDSYIKLIDAITQTYYGNVKKNVLYKTVRNYNSCLEMALDEEDVKPIVYENLIKATHDALPTMHEYISVRKKVLKQEQHVYDLYVPLVEDADMSLPFDEAYALVVKGLGALGKEYQSLLEKAKAERWIDVYENEGKRNGAYSAGAYNSPHPYVLLNYQPTTNDIFTIAHEMGHALHTYKSTHAQPQAKASYTIFLAEIASTVNEVLLLKYLYKESQDKNLKKYLLNYYMDTIRATLFRQTQFAEFEQKAHEKVENGEALTKESLSELYYALNKQYYGESLCHDERIAYEWARIPHFYNAFYVYKYATGIISAISIVKRILTEGESAVKDYFEFLSSGGCSDPVSILKKAGVDLEKEQPFKVAMQEFKDTLEEFKSLLED